MVSGVGVINPLPAHSWPMVNTSSGGSGGSGGYWHQTTSQTPGSWDSFWSFLHYIYHCYLSLLNKSGFRWWAPYGCDPECVWRTWRKVVKVSHHDNILYMFYGSFYVICILTYLYSLHKYRPLDHNTNYISQGARFVLIFSSLCLYCPVLDQELSELNGVCNIISLKTQIHVTRRALSSGDPYPWGGLLCWKIAFLVWLWQNVLVFFH